MVDRPPRRPRVAWDASALRVLRRHLGMTQQQMADQLGAHQQTVSEWETGVCRPRGASATLLTLIAERAGFDYQVAPGSAPPEPPDAAG